jgi:hypothetical protein
MVKMFGKLKNMLKHTQTQPTVIAESPRQESPLTAEARILALRQGLVENGAVSEARPDGIVWSLRLGIWHNNSLTIVDEGYFRFHPSLPTVSFWRNKQELEEYERRRQVNREYAAKYNVSEDKAPYSSFELANMAAAVLDLELRQIDSLIDMELSRPDKSQVQTIALRRESGFVPVLKIQFG